jgi:broad specificity phosphatase PhoE
VARHGETTWNLAGRYQGRLESALSALGVRQATALADHFFARLGKGESVPARALSSPLLRCTATARLCTQRLGIEVDADERLIEIAHGTWEGRYREELERDDPSRYRAWREDPANVAFEGGERLTDVLRRWQSFAAELARSPGHTLVVTHDAVVRCALLEATGRDLRDFWNTHVENAAFARFTADDRRLVLEAECETEHLSGLRADVAGQAL